MFLRCSRQRLPREAEEAPLRPASSPLHHKPNDRVPATSNSRVLNVSIGVVRPRASGRNGCHKCSVCSDFSDSILHGLCCSCRRYELSASKASGSPESIRVFARPDCSCACAASRWTGPFRCGSHALLAVASCLTS